MDPLTFKGMKLVISTPMYRYEVCQAYRQSRTFLERVLIAAQLEHSPQDHDVSDTYLDRARNILAAEFLKTDATHQLLLDADMGWDVADVLRMLYHAAENDKIWILGAAYPYKGVDWKRVIAAVKHNPEITPEQLQCVAPGKWTFAGLPTGQYDIGKPVQLAGDKAHVGTGIMLISRKAYEALAPHCESYFDQRAGMRVTRFFRCEVAEDSWRGEDVWFCREAVTKANIRLWLAPWVKTEHWGPYCTKGDVGKVVDAKMQMELGG